MCELVKSGDLNHGVIQVLWEKFAQKIGNTSIMESRGALLLLGMAATLVGFDVSHMLHLGATYKMWGKLDVNGPSIIYSVYDVNDVGI